MYWEELSIKQGCMALNVLCENEITGGQSIWSRDTNHHSICSHERKKQDMNNNIVYNKSKAFAENSVLFICCKAQNLWGKVL